nr:molecular chaperone Hsp33 [Candidatus Cloacimonadota bacterium]
MNTNEGSLLRGTICDNQFRLFAADTTAIVQYVRDTHDLYPLPSILMGRIITAAALMSGELKIPHSEITIRIDAEGALRGGIAIATIEGHLRGYAFEPKLWLEDSRDNLEVGKNLGKGTLTVIKQSGLKSPYQGSIALVDGEIATDLAHYYLQSEQIHSVVNLGVMIDPEARIRAAGGIMIQELPNADIRISKKIEANLAKTPNVSDLMDMGLSITDILHKFILKDVDWEITKSTPLSFACNCSKERFAKALLLLGSQELSQMQDGIEPICHYCNKSYPFSKEEISELIRSLDKK